MSNTNTPQDLIDNLNYLNETKSLIRQAITNKGQEITDDDTFRSYAAKISNIQGGSARALSSNIKVFSSKNEILSSTNGHNDKELALVYSNNSFDGLYTFDNIMIQPYNPEDYTYVYNHTPYFNLAKIDMPIVTNITSANFNVTLGIGNDPVPNTVEHHITSSQAIFSYVIPEIDWSFYSGSLINLVETIGADIVNMMNVAVVNVLYNCKEEDGKLYTGYRIDSCDQFLQNYYGLLPFIISAMSLDSVITDTFNNYWSNQNIAWNYQNLNPQINYMLSYRGDWYPAPTQFTAAGYHAASGIIYGYNGVEKGTLLSNISYNKTSDDILGRMELFINLANNIDTSNVTNLANAFCGCENIISVPNFDTSNVTDMSYMFGSNSYKKHPDDKLNITTYCNNLIAIPNFNTSKVTNMSMMFYHCENLREIPKFSTSNVTNMYQTFAGCSNLELMPNFSTSNVTNFRSVLSNCRKLKELPNFNTAKATDLLGAFSNCHSVKSVPNYNLSNVSCLYHTFSFLTNITTVPNFNTSTINNTYHMISGCTNLISVPNFRMNIVFDMSYMFTDDIKLTSIPSFNLYSIQNMEGAFRNCKSLSTLPAFTTPSLNRMNYMCDGCIKLTSIPKLNYTKVLSTTAYVAAFRNCKSLTNLSNISLSTINNYRSIITGCDLNLLYNLNLNNCYSIDGLFSYQELEELIDLSTLNNINLSLVNRVENLYRGCNFTTLNNFNLSEYTSANIAESMFAECNNLTSVDNINVSNQNNVIRFFDNSSNLVSVKNINISNTKHAGWFFLGCHNLKTVENINVNNTYNLWGMFQNCTNLEVAPILDTHNSTITRQIYSDCHSLKVVPDLDFASSNSAIFLFSDCFSLENAPNITNMGNIVNFKNGFINCYNLKNVPQYQLCSTIEDVQDMFAHCNNLSNASIHNIINMILNSTHENISMMNISNEYPYSPLYNTIFDSSYYSNRLSELTAAGWSY